MIRLAAVLACGLATASLTGAAHAAVSMPGAVARDGAPRITRVEYFCSPGFEPSYGGTCVAVPSRAEIELFVDQPIYETRAVVRHVRRHRRHGVRARY